MMPTSMLGGLALLTSLPAPEADQSQKRDEVRIELLACITRNFLSLEGATTPEILRGEILSRCRPQLPACSTVTNATPPRSQKQPHLRFACAQNLCLVREKRLRSGSLPGLG